MKNIRIAYIEKNVIDFVNHHLIKDIDIYFSKDCHYVRYHTHAETWDLLKVLIQTDFNEFGGVKIVSTNSEYTTLDDFNNCRDIINCDNRIELLLYCRINEAEANIRYIEGYEDEGWDEFARQYNNP